jgi:hypothetical protein
MRTLRAARSVGARARAEVIMPRFKVIVAMLPVALACTWVQAGDFAPRGGSSFAAVADDPGARSPVTDSATSTAAMSETTDAAAGATSHEAPAHASAPVRRAPARVGADDASGEAHASTSSAGDSSDDKAPTTTTAHKGRGALRWQSLLPGVMK